MPKGGRQGKLDRIRYKTRSRRTSDDESCNDNASEFSNDSEVRSTEIGEPDVVEDIAQQEAFEDKLMEAMEGLMQKSAAGRTSCHEAINKAFIKKYIPDFVQDRYLTICDGIEKGLKKGKGAEQAAAAQQAPLLCVQLGSGAASEEVCRILKPILLISTNDNSVPPLSRAKCCTALGLMIFLAGEDMAEVIQMMQVFENIFSGSYLKGDGSVPNVTVEVGTLHAAAISSWTLLFTLMSSNDAYNMLTMETSFSPSILQLSQLLTSPNLEVRISAGEALAIVFELGRICEDDFAENYITDLVDTFKELATDSHKYRAKKDRKQQRATFRDILNYIENDEMPDYKVKFATEQLDINSWTARKQYDSFCTMLGSGMNIHLTENDLLRQIFELGQRPQLIESIADSKKTKQVKHQQNMANFKARTISRGKNRDKRSDF
ncbi:PREDICTED: interferon-related developmental regulator 2 [Nicrophorus vespilloides]|uniref:Interferon-related developmental regulator 2 n=1 Tax=Nicrophorus vespilloides TaxID=110193 RepID=A0ABM1MRB3_NICVS|nr:PREDICTED: interferon-related developmental regulator 2 [Nicrophorus vespilloides]